MPLVGRVAVGRGAATTEHVVLVWDINKTVVAAGVSVEVASWSEEFAALIDRIASRFARYEPLRHAAEVCLS